MSARLPILTYHSLDDSGSVLSTSPAAFAAQMRWLQEERAVSLTLPAAIDACRRRSLPERAFAITFDDGFRSVHEHALPILARYQFTATVFVVTDYIGLDNTWPTQPRGVIHRPLLDWHQIREMSDAGFAIGAHTRTHPFLTHLTSAEAQREIVGSKALLEEQTQRSVDAFAYPYGAFDSRIREIVAGHFPLACSAELDFVDGRCDPLALARIDAYYVRSALVFRRLRSPTIGAYLRLRKLARAARGQFGTGGRAYGSRR